MLPATNDASYRAMSYAGCAHHDTHPMYIRPIATLLGLEPAPLSRCRVLELGCAEGRNLLPMAAGHPDARFVGLDLSERHIQVARECASALGLGNIQFVAADIEESGDDLGTFDYILVHGVYSWVPEAARRRVMALCRALLAPQGVAYISHNIYPGWHRKDAVRRMMLHQIRDVESPADQVAAAKALIQFLSDAASPNDPSYAAWLKDEADFLAGCDDFYVFHEHIAVHNEPTYFHEFMAEAHAHGLQFVADAFLPANFGKMMPDALCQELLRHSGPERLDFEQHCDFLLNRTFRKTLLCRDDAPVAMPPRLASWADTHALCPFEPAPDVEADPGLTAWRKGPLVVNVSPPIEALLEILAARWPCSMPVAELFAAYCERAEDGGAEESTLEAFCGQLFTPAIFELIQISAVPVISGVSAERPELTASVRHQLHTRATPLTTAHHNTATLTEPLRELALLADGTRDLDQLAAALGPSWTAVPPPEQPAAEQPGPDEKASPPLTERVARAVTYLRYLGLLR
ncbi:MAG: class I SAM-dependent methyltransferase [Myxococcota bacterium]